MKQTIKCPVCNQQHKKRRFEAPFECSNCHYIIDPNINDISKDTFLLLISINNNDYEEINKISSKYQNILIFDYFKMYSNIKLNIREDLTFFKKEFENIDNLNIVINHILQNKSLYCDTLVIEFFNKYANIDIDIFMNELFIDEVKDQNMLMLIDELKSVTKIPPLSNNQKTFFIKPGHIFVLGVLSLAITLLISLFIDGSSKYQITTILSFAPTIFIFIAMKKVIPIKLGVVINIIQFVIIFLIISYIATMFCRDEVFNFINHINKLINQLKNLIMPPKGNVK